MSLSTKTSISLSKMLAILNIGSSVEITLQNVLDSARITLKNNEAKHYHFTYILAKIYLQKLNN